MSEPAPSSPLDDARSDVTSDQLLARARLGDVAALGRLLAREAPGVRRWARGRLARWARTAADTTDLVQDAVVRTLRRGDALDLRSTSALAAYLRSAVVRRICDEHRRFARQGPPTDDMRKLADPAPSPAAQLEQRERERRYLAALARLDPHDRELIVAHVELDYSHEQLGCMTGRSANAARMALSRAVQRLAVAIGDV